jgi:hypothetical protein
MSMLALWILEVAMPEAWYDEYTAAHEVRPYMVTQDEGDKRELVLLRTKLEIRTWFLRASLALNTGLIAGWMITVALK